jgi:hypothetical protein
MTTISPSRPSVGSRSSSSKQLGRRSSQVKRDRRSRRASGHGLLGRYVDIVGDAREVVALPGALGSVLVVDRDSSTLGDLRLIAHLAGDEPPENARLVCDGYLKDSRGRWSRSVTPEDLQAVPFAEEQLPDAPGAVPPGEVELTDRHGRISTEGAHRRALRSLGALVPVLCGSGMRSAPGGERARGHRLHGELSACAWPDA